MAKQTDFQADRVLTLGQLTGKKEIANPSHFLKFLLTSRTNGTFDFARHTSRPFSKCEAFANTAENQTLGEQNQKSRLISSH